MTMVERVAASRDARAQRRKAVIRECVTWLHDRAKSMNDPHARDVLNSAALHLGETLGHDALAEAAANLTRPAVSEGPRRTTALGTICRE